jgi:hypothetical protein
VDRYPHSIPPIPVAQAASAVHLLAGLIYEAPAECEVAKLRATFSDGGAEEFPLVAGRHVWPDAVEPPEKDPPESRLAWRRSAGTRHAPHAIYHVQWNLKQPGRILKQLDFSSGDCSSCPFLLAITLT